jgi:hypothetical protein
MSSFDLLKGGSMPSIFNACIVNAGNTGGFCNSQDVGILYAIEYVFSYYPPLFLLMWLGFIGLGIPNGASSVQV